MADQWHYARNGAKHGPVKARDLKTLAANGKLRPTDTVWKAGMTDPVPASRVKGLFPTMDEVASAPPPLPDIAAVSSPPLPDVAAASLTDLDDAVSSQRNPVDFSALDGADDSSYRTGSVDAQVEPAPVDTLNNGVLFGGEADNVSAFHPGSHGDRNAKLRTNGLPVPLNEIPDRFRCYIQDDETVLYASNPSRNARVLSMILLGSVPGIPLLFYVLGAILAGEFMVLLFGLVIGLMLVSLFAYISHLNWKNQFYIITNSRTIVSQGIFNIAVRIVFNHNIQMIAVNTGVIDRWLDLNSVQLSTSGSGGGIPIFAFFPGMSPGNVQLRWVADAPNVVGLISSGLNK